MTRCPVPLTPLDVLLGSNPYGKPEARPQKPVKP